MSLSHDRMTPAELELAVKRREEWLALIEDPSCWPARPVLYLTRRRGHGWPELALVHEDDLIGVVHACDDGGKPTGRRLFFPTWEAMFAAGWEVD